MSVYTVQEHEFPGTLAGLDEAIEVAAMLASAREVPILMASCGLTAMTTIRWPT